MNTNYQRIMRILVPIILMTSIILFVGLTANAFALEVKQSQKADFMIDDEFSSNTMDIEQEIQLYDNTSVFLDTYGHWSEDIINFWVERNIVSGYPDGSFQPDNSISRAEAASLTAKIMNLNDEFDPVFYDVPEDYWAFDSIQACYLSGIMKGMGNGLFCPSESISRQEAMTMLYRASSLTSSGTEEEILNKIPDQDEIAEWAREAAAVLIREGIITGDENGILHPVDVVTRAEYLTILYRMENLDVWGSENYRAFGLTGFICSVNSALSETNKTINITTGNTDNSILIFPEFVDLHQIKLCFTKDSSVDIDVMITGNKESSTETFFDLLDISDPDEEGAYPLMISLSDGEIQTEYNYRIFCGTGLDAIFLTSEEGSGGRSFVDEEKGNSVAGTMQMFSAAGEIIYDGDLSEIKSRGNSTFSFPKKPYQIKLGEKSDLFRNGEKLKTWVLLANYADSTMIKDKLCKDLAIDFNLSGTPNCNWIDLYFDGEYRGVYLLTEKIQIASTGLNITNLEEMYEDINADYSDHTTTVIDENRYGNQIQYIEGIQDPENINNGYLIELNTTMYDENCGFITSRGKGVNIKSPENMSKEAVKSISEYYQEFEDAVYAVNIKGKHTGINPDTDRSFTDYCDLESMVRMYLLFQFSLNADAYYGSTYFYKENDILHQGPMWDSDLSFGTIYNGRYTPYHGLQNSYLTESLEQIPLFRNAVKKVYDDEFRNLALYYTKQRMNEYYHLLAGSEFFNHLIWPEYHIAPGLADPYPEDTSYEDIVQEMKKWMLTRIQYLDQKFSRWG